jgi:dihydropteroate synthase
MTRTWTIGAGQQIDLDRPRIVAILNLTPDSFHDGGVLSNTADVVAAARRARDAGADLLDLGAESTRPGAAAVSPAQQIQRLVPALQAIEDAGVGLPLSIDTTHSAVLAAACDASASVAVVNDVSGGREDPNLLTLAAERRLGVILMHRLVAPQRDRYSDQYRSAPAYQDVAVEVAAFLAQRLEVAADVGIHPGRILVDPGLGFGKSVEQNLELMRQSDRFAAMGAGVLSALSRKSFVGRVSLGRESTPSERLAGTLALSVLHWRFGARVFRVHDVAPHAEALRAAAAADRFADGLGA